MAPDEARDPYKTKQAREGEEKIKQAEALLARSSAKFERLASKIEKLKQQQQS